MMIFFFVVRVVTCLLIFFRGGGEFSGLEKSYGNGTEVQIPRSFRKACCFNLDAGVTSVPGVTRCMC